jgi:ceramide glucosyltransferase
MLEGVHAGYVSAMTVPAAISALLVAVGLLLALLQAIAQRRLHRAAAPPLPRRLPGVSILKPLKGVDAHLRENLRSIFRLDYPDYEIILGAEDPGDPALAVARSVAAEHAHVASVVMASPRMIGFNPKVNNLANLARVARHQTFLISDSNVRVPPGHLKNLVAHRARAGGGLVWSLFRGTHGRGLGGALESLQLNVAVMGGVSGLMHLLRIPCAVGKSMLIDRKDLDGIGGFPFLSRFLAEDHVCAEELAARGRPVVVTGCLIDNVLGRRTLREFAARHLRWARVRRHVSLPCYLAEVLLNPTFLGLASLVIFRTTEVAVVAGVALAGMSAIACWSERELGVKRAWWLYPALELGLSTAKGVLWFVPFFSRTVVWRGHALTLRSRTRIELNPPPDQRPLNRQARAGLVTSV